MQLHGIGCHKSSFENGASLLRGTPPALSDATPGSRVASSHLALREPFLGPSNCNLCNSGRSVLFHFPRGDRYIRKACSSADNKNPGFFPRGPASLSPPSPTFVPLSKIWQHPEDVK
ncbi:hypothetical protein CEXT_524261 [Caerostris extrusa]|uniref:Uncharacterized protein n=1 Tax=Caerostris extrusa TaxID=172846 RepID=A0AAV4SVN7_CAEEX|nr:hypothetical protein CEXT_524261 [Caerostris extrusa]